MKWASGLALAAQLILVSFGTFCVDDSRRQFSYAVRPKQKKMSRRKSCCFKQRDTLSVNKIIITAVIANLHIRLISIPITISVVNKRGKKDILYEKYTLNM